MSKNSPIRTFGFQLARALAAALTVVLISRWLGSEGRGTLSILLFFVQILMIANEYAGGSSLANMVVRYPAGILLPFSHVWAIVVVTAGICILPFWLPHSADTTLVAMLAFPLAFLTIAWNVFQGYAMVFQRNVLQLLLEILRLLLVIVLAWMAGVFGAELLPVGWEIAAFGVNEIFVIYVLSTTAVLAMAWVLLRRRVHRGKLSLIPPSELLKSGFWSQNGHLVQFLNYRLSLVLLSEITGTDAASGIYANALLIADTIWIFGNSFGTIAHMRILQSQNPGFRADITLRYAVIAFAGTAAAVVVLAFVPASWFTWIFGSDFSALRETVLWLSPAILALGASTLFSHYLHAVNRFRILFAANTAGLLLQVGIALMLIPSLGLKGAALAADGGFILILLITGFVFFKANPGAELRGSFRLRALWKVLRG